VVADGPPLLCQYPDITASMMKYASTV